MATDNNRKTWKDVWTRLATVEAQLEMIIENTKVIPTMVEQIKVLQKNSDDNKDEHKNFWRTFVSSKAFFSWLGALSTVIAIVTVLLFLR